jgi:hypothetical protein
VHQGDPARHEGSAPPSERAPDPGYRLLVEREPSLAGLSYEVLVEAVDTGGEPIGLPRILVTFPPGERELIESNIDQNYAAAAGFRVVDVSPFPRECEGAATGTRRCIWQQPIDR